MSLEITYDHYKDTNNIVRKLIKRREILFILSFVSMAISLALTLSPELTITTIQELGKTKVSLPLKELYYIANTASVLTTTYLWIRYYQTILEIDSLFKYISKIEKNIQRKHYMEISREGSHYQKNNKEIKIIIKHFYISIMPIVMILAAITKIYHEIMIDNQIILVLKFIDTLSIMILIIVTSLFIYSKTR